jgi:hypothetical protein
MTRFNSRKRPVAGAGQNANKGISAGKHERFAGLRIRMMESVPRLEFDRTGECVFVPKNNDQKKGLSLLAEKWGWELVANEDGSYIVIHLRLRERHNQREYEWELIRNIRPIRFHNGFADVMPESEDEEEGIRLLAERKGWNIRKADDGRLFVSRKVKAA